MTGGLGWCGPEVRTVLTGIGGWAGGVGVDGSFCWAGMSAGGAGDAKPLVASSQIS